jgi:hypothetical protein
MIKNYRAHYVEPKGEDKFRTETGTGLMTRIRTLGPYTNPPAKAGGCSVGQEKPRTLAAFGKPVSFPNWNFQ